MPWKNTDAMNEKVRFIAAYLEEESNFTELCDIFEVSRKTGYKWVERYEKGGTRALEELCRARISHPNATSAEIVEKILAVRIAHPLWGAKKLRIILERRYPKLGFPALSTIGEILKRNKLVIPRKRKRRSSPHREPLRSYQEPNAVWCADFKGHFPVGDARCHPLTITDGYSRYILACEGLRKPCTKQSLPIFQRTFQEFGLPDAMRTDNGPPFSTTAPAGLSRLGIYFIRLGIVHERIMPARPDQNGRHERMHRTLKAATAKPPHASFVAQQKAFDRFQREFNEVRPHEALHQAVPTDFYRKSTRPYPAKLPEPNYPDHFDVKKTYPNGVVSIAGAQFYVSGALKEEWIGLEEISDGRWKIFFGPVELGIADVSLATRRGYRSFSNLVPTGRDANGWHGNPNLTK